MLNTAQNAESQQRKLNPLSLPPVDPRQRYSMPEACAYLRTSRQTIWELERAGKIRTISEGKRKYVPGSEIERLSRVD